MGYYAFFARDAGIKIIGGCCGTTPEHIAAMAAALAGPPSRLFDEVAAEANDAPRWSLGRRRSRG